MFVLYHSGNVNSTATIFPMEALVERPADRSEADAGFTGEQSSSDDERAMHLQEAITTLRAIEAAW